MANTWVAEVGNASVGIASRDELRAILSLTRQAAGQEFWLVHSDGRSMQMLRNGHRALLMFRDGDDGGSLLALADGGVPDVAMVGFTLANGQRDEYPAARTVSADQAIAALEHFFATAALAPFLTWRDGDNMT